MMYNSTRDSRVSVSSSQAIVQGISRDGGLFVPETLPRITGADIAALTSMPYADRAASVLSRFLTDFTGEETAQCTRAAYGSGAFRSPAVAPVHTLEEGLHILELWHGPTCAFKDMALQILPHLMRVSASKTGGGEIVILGATSGYTGKAALEGFRDAPHTRILVFYPEDGVSPMQKLQMTTQEGGNVGVCAIRGNFDDAQSGVKAIFTDEAVGNALRDHGMQFSSANSINWGRLVPQIVYYISAYCDLLADGKLKMGDTFNVVVPTGNFGNILAAYYAKEMGLPVASIRPFCISGMGFSGDSMMPLVHSVSGKHLRMNGANRSRRASASAMSASETTSWHTASVISKGRNLGLTHRVSFCSAISFKVASCSISFAAYSLIAMEKLLLSRLHGAAPGRGAV